MKVGFKKATVTALSVGEKRMILQLLVLTQQQRETDTYHSPRSVTQTL